MGTRPRILNEQGTGNGQHEIPRFELGLLRRLLLRHLPRTGFAHQCGNRAEISGRPLDISKACFHLNWRGDAVGGSPGSGTGDWRCAIAHLAASQAWRGSLRQGFGVAFLLQPATSVSPENGSRLTCHCAVIANLYALAARPRVSREQRKGG